MPELRAHGLDVFPVLASEDRGGSTGPADSGLRLDARGREGSHEHLPQGGRPQRVPPGHPPLVAGFAPGGDDREERLVGAEVGRQGGQVELEGAPEASGHRDRPQLLPVPLPTLVDPERQDLPRQVDVPDPDPVELRRPAARPKADLDGRPGHSSERQDAENLRDRGGSQRLRGARGAGECSARTSPGRASPPSRGPSGGSPGHS